MDIFSYVVARDFGFAPNPFYQVCTLATCKPLIRQAAKIGDYVVGTMPTPQESVLVFYMKVEEILSFDQYWNDVRFQAKKPNFMSSKKAAFGDNIYHHSDEGVWLQADSHHTNDDGSVSDANIRTDTGSDRVLLSTNFCYWGGNGPTLPDELMSLSKKGPGHKRYFEEQFKLDVVQWLTGQQRGFVGHPRNWYQ